MIRSLLADFPTWGRVGIALGTAVVVAFLVAEVIARGIRLVLRKLMGRHVDSLAAAAIGKSVRYARGFAFLALFVALIPPALEVSGVVDRVGPDPEAIVEWFMESGLRIAIVGGLAWLLMRVVAMIIVRMERDIAESNAPQAIERARRLRTLGGLVGNIVAVVVYSTATLMILRELRIDVVPILTGAGIVGLAIGFGAQTLVKDFISGFFLILENQVRLGDVAVINGVGGVVETINLRTIALRDMEGAVHVFPNGSINTLANRSKDYSYAVIDVDVDYRDDTDRVVQVLREIGAEVQRDAVVGPSVLEGIEVLGVDALAKSSVIIKSRIKTLPLKQWEVGRELRRRIKQRFEVEGIAIPYPQVVVSVRDRADALLARETEAVARAAAAATDEGRAAGTDRP